MKILRTITELRAELKQHTDAGSTVGFVPTMGAFHEGHTSLMRAARQQHDIVVVSLFVNPSQFPDRAVFDRYPRDERRDAAMAEAEGVDMLFAPLVEEIYPKGFATVVSVEGELADTLLKTKLSMDGQLTGMCTIIVKLLNIVQPTTVFFGEKDLPHWIAVERMAADLNLPAEIVVLPTVRECDGLAMSSRNVHLGEHRERAGCVPSALRAALDTASSGMRDPQLARDRALAELAVAHVEVDYVEILNARTLRVITDLSEPAVIAIGARVGGVPLLDIARTHPPATPTVA
ncbi:pantoate--beta-alanine ligase [Microbispora sp. KK1-11]|uniref:pantoate--beta-alanine ligase n=1 Tax=Microbispora sp. KK1-11 TaxID=2053005 RepID=UPI00163C4409|nr:pantoate--beta-alanine ligase [Microbispora sp. KK1-11]